MEGKIGISGRLGIRVRHAEKPPLVWRIKQTWRLSFFLGMLYFWLARWFSKITGISTIVSELRAVVFKADGKVIDYGLLSHRLTTDTGVAFIVDDWDNSVTDITNIKYHGCGIGAVAENKTDTALGNECTTVLNPDSTRATATNSQPLAYQLQQVGTLTFDGVAAVTEHGVLSQAATGGGVLWDRSVFTAINVVSGDSIQFTYTLTVNSNG